MRRIPLMLGIAVAAGSLLSCRQELDSVTPAPAAASATSLSGPAQLAASSWHQTGLLVNTTSKTETSSADLFSHVSASLLDQSATFQADGTYTVVKGGPTPTTKVGRWLLSAAGDSLILKLPTQVRRLAVTKLAPDALNLSFTDVAPNGVKSTYTAVYAH